jgi:hypothetical protein
MHCGDALHARTDTLSLPTTCAVYLFKDQLGAITKKDFVPYSERRRLEQARGAANGFQGAHRPKPSAASSPSSRVQRLYSSSQ